jgi:hypothetical protein
MNKRIYDNYRYFGTTYQGIINQIAEVTQAPLRSREQTVLTFILLLVQRHQIYRLARSGRF